MRILQNLHKLGLRSAQQHESHGGWLAIQLQGGLSSEGLSRATKCGDAITPRAEPRSREERALACAMCVLREGQAK